MDTSAWREDLTGQAALDELRTSLTLEGLVTPLVPPRLTPSMLRHSSVRMWATAPPPGPDHHWHSAFRSRSAWRTLIADAAGLSEPFLLVIDERPDRRGVIVRAGDTLAFIRSPSTEAFNRTAAAVSELLLWAPDRNAPLRCWMATDRDDQVELAVAERPGGAWAGLEYLPGQDWRPIAVVGSGDDDAVGRAALVEACASPDASVARLAQLGLGLLGPERLSPTPAPEHMLADAVAQAIEAAINPGGVTLVDRVEATIRTSVPSLSDRQCIPRPPVNQLLAWRIFSELVRRHPGVVELSLGWYPAGSPMLEATRVDVERGVSLNFNGGLYGHGDRTSNDPNFWQRAIEQGTDHAIAHLEDLLGLPRVGRAARSVGASLTPMLIAGHLARWAFAPRSPEVVALYEPEDWDGELAGFIQRAQAAGLPVRMRTLWSGTLPACWVVLDHTEDRRPLAALTADGQAFLHSDGRLIDLEQEYARLGRSIQALVSRVFP